MISVVHVMSRVGVMGTIGWSSMAGRVMIGPLVLGHSEAFWCIAYLNRNK